MERPDQLVRVLGPGGEDLGPQPGEEPRFGSGGSAGDAVGDGAEGAAGVGDKAFYQIELFLLIFLLYKQGG